MTLLRTIVRLFLLVPGLLVPALPALGSGGGQLSLYVVGHAFDESGDALLYRELHRCDSTRSQCIIDYLDPAEQPLARKALDYRAGAHAPAVDMQNLLAQSNQTASGGGDLVVDAGFDNYVRSRWEDLEGGDTVRFPFLVLGREEPLVMQAMRSDAECARDALCLEVSPDAWYLRLLVPPIELTYERDSRRLLRYRGIGNLRDAQGNSRAVDIRYRYVDEAVAALEAQNQ